MSVRVRVNANGLEWFRGSHWIPVATPELAVALRYYVDEIASSYPTKEDREFAALFAA